MCGRRASRRHAAGVDRCRRREPTSATAVRRQAAGEEGTGLAGADDDRVERTSWQGADDECRADLRNGVRRKLQVVSSEGLGPAARAGRSRCVPMTAP